MSYFPNTGANYDALRGKYLEENITIVDFYAPSSSVKKKSMNHLPSVASSDAPFAVEGAYVIIGIECRLNDIATGDIISILDNDTRAIIYTVTVTNSDYFFSDTINIDVQDVKISAYVNGRFISIPVLKLQLKKIFIP